jgi:hypothetical protein
MVQFFTNFLKAILPAAVNPAKMLLDPDFFRGSDSGIRQWDERNNFAILNAPDPNSRFEARISFVVGL